MKEEVSVQNQAVNVVQLFGLKMEEVSDLDPMAELLKEAGVEMVEAPLKVERRILVSENSFPDQSMYVLDQQLSKLKESVGRIKFYLSDLDDLLPR